MAETSDSEYFESADEDFEPEKITVEKDDENTKDNKINSEIKTPLNKETQSISHSPTTEVQVESSVKLDKTEIKIKQKEIKPENDAIQETEVCDKKSQPEKPKKESKIKAKLGSKIVRNQEEIQPEIKSELPKLATPPPPPLPTPISKPEIEEDLWGEEELDWGQENEKEQQESTSEDTGWGGWGNWGVTSILSTATQSVSTLTNHVSQGLNTVLESSIGIPEPEELAKINRDENAKIEEKLKELNVSQTKNEPEINPLGFDLSGLVSGVTHLTKFVESTGTKVITGGLDTLETIGKKTMEVLQEGDPGLKKKRAFLKLDQNKPILSQILKEAKEKYEEESRILKEKHFAAKAKNYETLFDDHQGLVHLEALEMLSKQCSIKLQTLLENNTEDELIDLQETMNQVKELCELPEDDDEEEAKAEWQELKDKLESGVADFGIAISYKKLTETWEEVDEWLKNLKLDVCDERELHQQAIETMAQLTAMAVEQYHKAAELMLIKEHRSTADEADSLVQLTTSLISIISLVSDQFSKKLTDKRNQSDDKDKINELITNVFYEAANSSSYVKNAFQLLIPILQVGAT